MLQPPLPARTNGVTLALLNASVRGVRLSHVAPFAERKTYTFSFDWRGKTIRFLAEPRWTSPRADKYESGFEIVNIDAESDEGLRLLIEEALRKTPRYDRHELLHGVWIRTTTTDSRQPQSGFTVATTESPHTIDFFRAAFMRGNRELRERIRRLAAMSIEHPERLYDA